MGRPRAPLVKYPGELVARNRVQLLPGNLIAMTLTAGKVTVLDAADFALVANWRWHTHAASSGLLYARTNRGPDWRPVSMHQLLFGSRWVDHKDGNGLNNRRSNLRAVTTEQNLHNQRRRSDNTAGFKGVRREASGQSFGARIQVRGKSYYLGRYATAEEAARAYDEAARKYFGDYARLNFPVVH